MGRLSVGERVELWDRWEAGEPLRSMCEDAGEVAVDGEDGVGVVEVAAPGAALCVATEVGQRDDVLWI
jgi:hypothetical protein